MVTVAEIAKTAFDAVASQITDAIHPATLGWVEKGAYDPEAGKYTETPKSDTGRVVVDSAKPVADIFEGYIVGPADQLILMEGFKTAPVENYTLTFAGQTLTITRVQDIVAAGSLYYCVAV